jgi:hypothetical protein
MKKISSLFVLYIFVTVQYSVGQVLKKGLVVDNYALSLPGGASGMVSNVAIPALNIASLPVTIEMWYKPDAVQNYYCTLWYCRSTNNCGVQYDRWGDITKIKGVWNGTSGTGLSTEKPIAGIWNHVALVVTTTSKTLYINGVPFSQAGSYANFPFDNVLYLGWDSASSTIIDRTLKGQIDEFRIWNMARTAQELEDNKYKTLTGSETGLIGYWNFNDQATMATDLTVNGRHGKITGGTYVLSNALDTMVYVSSSVSKISKEVNTPSTNNLIARLGVITVNPIKPLYLATLCLNNAGTTFLTDISSVKVYYTAADSVFNTNTLIANLGASPVSEKYAIVLNQQLAEGVNYFWITCDIAKGAAKGNIVVANCDSILLSGLTTYIPSNASPAGQLTINPDIYMPNVKLPVSVVTSLGQTPSGGANFVSFQQNAITTYNGYQYVAYWNNAYRVCLARRKLPLGSWEIIEFADYTVTAARIADNHYSISIGICPNDGTIHVAFDHHGDNLHYRRSVVGLANKPGEILWAASSFGVVQNYLIVGQPMAQVTYPRYIIKPNGDLLYEYRYGTSGAGDSYLYEYAAATGTWSSIGKYLDGLTVNNNAYLNGIHYDRNGRLHASWVWRETPDPLTNHDICYVYSDDHGRTWYNHLGVLMGAVNSNAIKSTTNGIIVWPLSQNRGLINQESQVVDSKGGIHLLQSFLPESFANSTNFWTGRNSAYLRHLYKDENGNWKCDNIGAISANRSQIAIDEGDNLYVVAPNYRIYYASAIEKWKKWTVLDVSESASAINEGLIDRELLLNESVLSFVFAQTGSKIIVPYYLIDKSKSGKGKGLCMSVHSGADLGTHFYQKLDSVNLNSGSIPYSVDSVSVRCMGTLETKYAEAYTLYFTTNGDAKVWINDNLVLNTGIISGQTSFPIVLSLQPSHKYAIKIEGKYATPNVIVKLEWESERQTRELVPLNALYGSLIENPNINPITAQEIIGYCQPNPFIGNTTLMVNGKFDYKLFDLKGKLLTEGTANNHLEIGSNLSKGVYILKINQGVKNKTLKLVKM